MLGEAFEAKHLVNEVVGRMLLLDAFKPSYMPKKGGSQGEYRYKTVITETILRQSDKDDDPVPELVGPQNEVAIAFNFVPGTTIDTDRLSYGSGNEIQIFGWDIWEMYEEAARLYPYNMYDKLGVQHDAVMRRMKHVITRTLLWAYRRPWC